MRQGSRVVGQTVAVRSQVSATARVLFCRIHVLEPDRHTPLFTVVTQTEG